MSRLDDLQMLGLSEGASPLEIRAAWRKLSLDLHPDQGGDSRVWREHRAAFQRLLSASPPAAEAPDDGQPTGLLDLADRLLAKDTPEGRLARSLLSFFRS